MTTPPHPDAPNVGATDVNVFLAACSAQGVAVLRDPDVVATHTVDWTGRWRGDAAAVLRPMSTDEVVAVVSAARQHGVALVPQGGNTGLVGGAVPEASEVVVDLRRLDGLGPVDRAASQVTVGAGATLAAVGAHTRDAGLRVAVDLASRGTATIGGMVATNAGGIHVIRYGTMRAQVLGLEAVLGTGERVEVNLAGLLKDNTGYDLAGLLCGSEGTLGIITAVRLRLVPIPSSRVVALLSLGSLADAMAILPALRTAASLHAVEVMQRGGMTIVGAHLGEPVPLAQDAEVGLLVELAGEGDVIAEMEGVLSRAHDQVIDTSVATDSLLAARLWRWRDAHPEAAAALGLVHKADITLPADRLVEAVGRIEEAIAATAPGAVVMIYGHLADGNLHVNVVGPAPHDDTVIDEVLGIALDEGGSVSAEHGVGTAKRAWLEPQRGTAVVTTMRAIKAALDPDGILNPRALLG